MSAPKTKSLTREVEKALEERFEHCQRFRESFLNLGYLELPSLPKSLHKRLLEVSWIETLNLSFNHLTRLPEWLGDLPNLRNLYLVGNTLEALPAFLPRLPLERLNLEVRSPSVLREELGSLQHLRFLGIPSSGLTQLPPWVREFRRLQYLNLVFNKLTTLPEWLGELTELTGLDLQQNQLRKLPASLLKLDVLKRLDLRGNKELGLPYEIQRTVCARNILH
jgi:Leucine-rich repeat (LRR) protein